MALRHSSKPTASESSDSESDSGIPETISLSHSKKQVQQLENEVKNANLAVKERQKELRREKDKKLKERAKSNHEKISNPKGKQKADTSTRQPPKRRQEESSEDDSEDDEDREDSGVDDFGLEARMRRAMKEAEEEAMGDSDEGDEDQFGAFLDNDGSGDSEQDSDDDDEGTSGTGIDEADDSGNDSLASDEDEESPMPTPKKTKPNPNHLPDELFAAAFAGQPATKSKRKLSDEDQKAPTRPSKRRKRAKKQKDLVLGNRVIRVLPSSTQPVVPTTLPSRKTKKFLDRTLALRGGKQKSKLWERRPANIGVLRRDGPAYSFVRNP